MKVYRSIGKEELYYLLSSFNPVYGKRIWSNIKGSGCPITEYGTVCFFVDNIKWIDSQHCFHIIVDIPNDSAVGEGVYMASKNFGITKIFTGREGKTKFCIKEAFTRFYNPSDIILLDIGNSFANHFLESTIKPFCKKYDVVLKCNNR